MHEQWNGNTLDKYGTITEEGSEGQASALAWNCSGTTWNPGTALEKYRGSSLKLTMEKRISGFTILIVALFNYVYNSEKVIVITSNNN